MPCDSTGAFCRLPARVLQAKAIQSVATGTGSFKFVQDLPKRLPPIAAAATAMLLAQPIQVRALDRCVDVALVLAVDGSDSIDAREHRLQQDAIAGALRDPDVVATFSEVGAVSTAVVFWGDASRPVFRTETVIIRDAADADRLAQIVESQPSQTKGTTGLGAGLAASLETLASMGCAHRSIINVSGDGKETVVPRKRTSSPRPDQVKEKAQSLNVTINGLVVSAAGQEVGDYFREKVITGPGAFVIEIEDFGDYAGALKRKLIREVSNLAISASQDLRPTRYE